MDEKQANFLKTGTTTVGLLGKGFVVLAADKRATAGNLIVDKNTKKVESIASNVAVTTSGTVSDLQLLVRYVKAELRIKDVRTGRDSTVREAANLLAGMTYGTIRRYSGILGVCHFLLGGYDSNGEQLYEIYPDGSIMNLPKDSGFVASGSGSVLAYGVLEDQWKKEMSESEAVQLAVRAVNAALQRDTGSGQGVDVFVIDKSGVKQAVQKLLNTRIQ